MPSTYGVVSSITHMAARPRWTSATLAIAVAKKRALVRGDHRVALVSSLAFAFAFAVVLTSVGAGAGAGAAPPRNRVYVKRSTAADIW